MNLWTGDLFVGGAAPGLMFLLNQMGTYYIIIELF